MQRIDLLRLPTLAYCVGLLLLLGAASGASGQILFDENYASGATSASSLTPSQVQNAGMTATPIIGIQNFIVNPATNGGSNQGPKILTFDASAPNPQGVPEGFQPISFNNPPHPDDPSGYTEIIASGAWWTDHPTTFFHQNASASLSPQLASRSKVYVIDYSVGSNMARESDEEVGVRIGLFDDKDQGVYLGQNFSNKSTPRRPNQLNVHRINSDGENVHINVNGNFSSGSKRLHYGQYDPITAPSLDFSDFKLRGQDQSGVLSELFEDEAVIRFHELDKGRMSIEWFVAASIPTDPLDPTTTPFGGFEGTRPERDGWHNFTTLENIYDLSGSEKTPLGDFSKLRISMWNPRIGTNGWTVSDLSTINTHPGPTRASNNQQAGFGYIKVSEYHVGDLNRDGAVTSADVTATPLLQNLNVMTDRVWKDGETTGDDRVTVGDALAGVLTALAGAGPSGPQLLYTVGTGNLKIDTAGQSLSGFALLAAEGNNLSFGLYNNPNPNQASAIETVESFELAWMNLTVAGAQAGGNLLGVIDLGNILPTGLSPEQFEAFFAGAVYNVGGALTKATSFFAIPAPVLAGDYNGDGFVDAADYTVWRDALGTSATLPGDLIGGMIGQAQYDQWKNNFGGAASLAAATASPIPEPTSLTLVAGSLGLLWLTRRGRGSDFPA